MPSSFRRRFAALPIAILTLAPSLIAVSAADAATPRCAGRTATRVGTPGNDVIFGTGGVDVIVAGAGNDRIYGFGGNDIICAGNGADYVEAGFGNDRVFGGNGNDSLRGGYGFDRILGGNGSDWLVGDPGRDYIAGGNGNDDIFGGDDNDDLHGNMGNDRIAGQRGFDTVAGGWGEDLVLGENSRPDPDANFTKQVLAQTFADVGSVCRTGCIAGSATWRSIQPIAGPAGASFDQVLFQYDSEGFALQMRLRDSSRPIGSSVNQSTEFYASGWLASYGNPRSNQWSVARHLSGQRNDGVTPLQAARYVSWVVNRLN